MNRNVFIVALGLAVLRFAAFLFIFLNNRSDVAQWQLAYLPLRAADLPVSLAYRWIPVPWAEAVIGPTWWFCLPLIFAWLFQRLRTQA